MADLRYNMIINTRNSMNNDKHDMYGLGYPEYVKINNNCETL